MGNIKLRNNITGEIIEKTELNWKHLPNDRKAQYTVVDGEVNASAPVKNFSPPELQKKEAPKAEAEKEVDNPADETQDQAIVRLFNAAEPKNEDEKKEVIKSIAKQIAAHFKTVEKVVNASFKK